ncbi:beta,beta-carotene 15,15'-dioxygenase-like [Panonychus citri]|uniref:beta,beta-carotene 15,15'-dioxygenase-like n=1 Tax=Panonychus citri TaxID=50023 RepID=UPI0023078AAA|nr:beta,beta-carotene 15,15'-dioxygenase-like [Panonychus citri]
MELIEPHFRSVNECPQEVECQILGSLPEWLQGSLIRLGPGKWDLEDGFTLNHWLDGCAMLIKFRFEDGRVFYSSKFLRSNAFTKMMAHGKPVFTEFGTRAYPDPSKPLVARLINQLIPSDLTDNDISNIYLMNKRLFVATESCNIWRVDPANMTGIEKFNLDREASVNLSTSHPLYSASDDSYYNVGTNFLSGMKYSIYRVPKREDSKSPSSNPFKGVKKIAVIPSRWKTGFSYIHSFAMTENFIIIIEQPLVVNGFKLATCTLKGKSMEECLEWRPDEPTRFYVINKSTGKEQEFDFEYETEAFFFFHVMNAYEQDGHAIIDLVAYEDIKVLEKYHLKYLRSNEFNDQCQPTARRYVLPLEKRVPQQNIKSQNNLVDLPNCSASAYLIDGIIKLTYEQLAEPGFELPTLNDSFACTKYRYAYGSGTFEQGTFSHSAIKLDLETHEVRMWKSSETAFPGEAFFIPKPDNQGEDDGIILSAVLESDQSKKSFLILLDARTMMEMARILIPRDLAEIPPTIHGVFISNIKEIVI